MKNVAVEFRANEEDAGTEIIMAIFVYCSAQILIHRHGEINIAVSGFNKTH